MDASAIKEIQSAHAFAAINAALASGAPSVAMPSEFSVVSTEALMPNRRRARGTMSTTHLGSFAGYVEAFKQSGTKTFVSPQRMTATAVLNLGTTEAPGHADDCARFAPEQTAAYQALLAFVSGAQQQKKAAEFFEDWVHQIKFFDENEQIRPEQAIAAIRNITIEAVRKHETTVGNLSAQQSAFESIQATSKSNIPTLIYFTCQPYDALEERVFVMRLSILTSEPQPTLRLRIVKHEEHVEEMAKELALIVRMELGADDDKADVLIGEYTTQK